ncbi:hypothetical protein HMPREF1556_00616 [Porphyromonas sp. oral taxon 278 str. W7784]|nr:hypothetical protein HMPREF1556_00616 [Porphyromonas sp. oral taxon 278 str. W7784]
MAQKEQKKTYCRSPDRPTVGRITTYCRFFRRPTVDRFSPLPNARTKRARWMSIFSSQAPLKEEGRKKCAI